MGISKLIQGEFWTGPQHHNPSYWTIIPGRVESYREFQPPSPNISGRSSWMRDFTPHLEDLVRGLKALTM
jgi:hypothetical protein